MRREKWCILYLIWLPFSLTYNLLPPYSLPFWYPLLFTCTHCIFKNLIQLVFICIYQWVFLSLSRVHLTMLPTNLYNLRNTHYWYWMWQLLLFSLFKCLSLIRYVFGGVDRNYRWWELELILTWLKKNSRNFPDKRAVICVW